MSDIKRFCLSCDLKNNTKLIEEYKSFHTKGKVWPEITKSIRDAGILDMQIYLTGNRMFMIMECKSSFDPNHKAVMDANNPKVQEWENLMWNYQQELPWAKKGGKWVTMEKIFQLDK